MKNTIKYLFLLTTAFLILACESYDFGHTGKDTNNPTTIIPSSLLTGVISKLIGTVGMGGAGLPASYIHHLSPTSYAFKSSYQTTHFNWEVAGNGGGLDGNVNIYNKIFPNLLQIIALNTKETTKKKATAYGSNNNQIAVAKLLWAYYFQWATDQWGMLPYSEAFGGINASKPKYDTQEKIYKDLFDNIDEALTQIDDGTGPAGDLLFHGDMTKWVKFGNTLKMNMAIRLAKVYPATQGYAAIKFNEALPGALKSVMENIMYPTVTDNTFDQASKKRYTDLCKTENCLSEILAQRMKALKDPRLSKFNNPAAHMVNFVDVAYSTSNAKVALKNNEFIKSGTKGTPIFTYAQVSFNKAEAALLGWITGSAASYYNEGIKASMQQWGVSNSATEAYLKEHNVIYNEAHAIEQVAQQKWLALFFQPYEAWAEWRRLDYPIFISSKTSAIKHFIPLRHGYPLAEPYQNKANYEAAISTQGPDNLHTKLWWDVQ